MKPARDVVEAKNKVKVQSNNLEASKLEAVDGFLQVSDKPTQTQSLELMLMPEHCEMLKN